MPLQNKFRALYSSPFSYSRGLVAFSQLMGPFGPLTSKIVGQNHYFKKFFGFGSHKNAFVKMMKTNCKIDIPYGNR